MPDLYLALIHHPVVNKKGDTITSAVTNLDLHDMARAARTYGVKGFYVVTPLEDQKTLVEEIRAHWTSGVGGTLNPARKEALELIRIADSLSDIREELGEGLQVVVTSARKHPGSTGFSEFRDLLKDGRRYLLTFGTAWGISEELIEDSEYMLEPIRGNCDYNHLSVRSAASIILDRSLGEDCGN
jgi:hypothetical protein